MVKMERGIEIDGKHVCVRGQSHRKKRGICVNRSYETIE